MPQRTAMSGAAPTLVALGLAIGLSASLPQMAAAQARVIGPGHEAEVMALFSPHELGDEIASGFVLWNVDIRPDRISVTLRREDGRETVLQLVHPDRAPMGAASTASFGAVPLGASDAEADAARAALLDVVADNDPGRFWETATQVVATSDTNRLSLPSLWSDSEWVPVDGMAVIALVWVLGLLLAARLLRDAPRWMGPALAGVVVAGVAVRLALSPRTFLGAWPWSRLYPHVRAVAEGVLLERVAQLEGRPFFLTDVTEWTNFAYAAAMPLVLFAHGTYLLRDRRAGLAAAMAVAFLPQHIRFSRCEDGFVASLVLTSLAFALIHGWLRERSRVVRWLLLAALPLVLYPGYLLRPLNILFVAVYAAAILLVHGDTSARWRRGVALGVVCAVGAAAAVTMLGRHGDTVTSVDLGVGWLGTIVEVLLSPWLLVLTDPTRTPPALIVLALVGGVLAWRAGERRLVIFLCGWLLLFVATHAVVVQETMQPRYHLHLVVPFLLLVGLGVVHALDRDPRWRPWLIAAGALTVASPLLHVGFITDVGYTEMREQAFVRRARDRVPDHCTVLEPTGPDGANELRFERIGELVGAGRAQRFHPVAVLPSFETPADETPLEEILRDPPACLYLYEGLACVRHRQPGDRRARHCDALWDRLGPEVILEERVPVRLYDRANEGSHPIEADRIHLRLSRVPRAE